MVNLLALLQMEVVLWIMWLPLLHIMHIIEDFSINPLTLCSDHCPIMFSLSTNTSLPSPDIHEDTPFLTTYILQRQIGWNKQHLMNNVETSEKIIELKSLLPSLPYRHKCEKGYNINNRIT